MGRPKPGSLGHSPPELRAAVRAMRQAHPGWGPDTLRVELAADSRFQDLALPSRPRIAAFLKAEEVTRPYARHTDLVQPVPLIPGAPHEVWEMDAQGVRAVAGVGRVSVINIGDPYSHVRTESWVCVHTAKPDLPDYQLALRRGFLRYGLPQALSLDHDSVFFDNTSASPYPSRLHLWALALGLHVQFIHEGRPTEHGFIERTHEVLELQALEGQTFPNPDRLQVTLEQRLEMLNTRYPSRALAGHAPLVAYPAALHSGRAYWPEREADLLNLEPVYAYLARQHWFRQVTAPGQFSLGAYRYGLGKAWGTQTVEITFDAQTREFVCRSADGQRTQSVPAQGLTKADLMGELVTEQFPTYQYAFPWSAAVCRQNLLYTEMADTTL
jgi:hypothetical protein